MNSTSTRMFGRWLSLHLTAVCALGWTTAAVMIGSWLARREAEPEPGSALDVTP